VELAAIAWLSLELGSPQSRAEPAAPGQCERSSFDASDDDRCEPRSAGWNQVRRHDVVASMIGRRHTRIGVLLTLCVAGSLLGQQVSPAEASSTRQQVLAQVICKDAITTLANVLVMPRNVIGGQLRRFPDGRAQQIDDSGQPEFPFSSKTPLVVRAATRPFTIKIAPAWRGRAGMLWGNPQSNVAADGVRVVPCSRGDDNGDWVVWTGGFVVKEPGCVPLVVTMGYRVYRARVALGVACQ
jgi:hypothetical protein